MGKLTWAGIVIGTALAGSVAFAQDEGGFGGGGPARPPQKGPTALQLANPNYHPPAKRVPPSLGYLDSIKPTGDTPRMSDGHPDLSGMWTANFPSPAGADHRRGNTASEADQAAIQRASWWNKPVYKPELWQKVRDTDFSVADADPVFSCRPRGAPRDGQKPAIFMNTKQVWIFGGDELRVAPLDGRKRNPDDSDQSTITGIPLAHWEGDTLVVESTGFNDTTWFGWPGYFHSNRMELKETYTRNGNVLYYQYTITDPEVLAEPYTSIKYVFRLNPNPGAVPGARDECRPLPLDGQIVDKYFRG